MSKELLNEVSRIREMMTFLNNGKNLLNESGGLRVIARFGRRLAQNSIDDMVRLYGDEVGDILNKIVRLSDDDLDGLFKNINDLKYVNDEAAKVFRTDLRAVLPEDVDRSLTRLKDFLEENIADIEDIDGAISDYIDRQFGSQGDELKEALGDMVKDESPSIRSTSKKQNQLKNGDIDGIINDMVDDDIRNISEILMTDDEIMKAFKSENEWWNNAFFRIFVDRRREATRALQSYKIDDATKSVLKGKTKEEIRAIVKQEIKESLEGNDELMEIIKDKSFAGWWSRLGGKTKIGIILTLGLGGAPLIIVFFGLAALLKENASEFLVWLNDWVENWRKDFETKNA